MYFILWIIPLIIICLILYYDYIKKFNPVTPIGYLTIFFFACIPIINWFILVADIYESFMEDKLWFINFKMCLNTPLK